MEDGFHFSVRPLIFVFTVWSVSPHCITRANLDLCRHLKFTTPVDGYALHGHVIKNISLNFGMRASCRGRCTIENNCVSINIGPPISDKVLCQLSDSDHIRHPDDLKPRDGYMYAGTENPCFSNPCAENATCLNGFTDKKYVCVCQRGYTGEHCENDINECDNGMDDCHVNANCTNTIGSFICTCNVAYTGDGRICSSFARSCKQLFDLNLSTGNKAYPLLMGPSLELNIYCHMSNDLTGCGGGGWTLAMKIDGDKSWVISPTPNPQPGGPGSPFSLVPPLETCPACVTLQGAKAPAGRALRFIRAHLPLNHRQASNDVAMTFHYDSILWGNQEIYNHAGGETGFDLEETKLPSYWNTSFSKICLGMKISQQINFIVINKYADSLYSLIADGQYRATSLGRDTWKALIGSEGSLQSNCNKEGFNAVGNNPTHSKARIGWISNNENDCFSCDSRIGFGTGGHHADDNSCGNEAVLFPDNGDKHIKAMGYILIQ